MCCKLSELLSRATLFAALAVLAACSDANEPETSGPLPIGSGFDYYLLALSWSPSYCASVGEDASQQQCGAARPYGFIVHGLWPQFERGYPSNCPTDQPLSVPEEMMRGLYDIMPSDGLIRHQWKKHGTCSGLSRKDYFATLRAAHDAVAIPADYQRLESYKTVAVADLERAFLNANDGADETGVIVTCDRRFLREVRICMTRELKFRTCPELERSACRRDKAVMPPARGG